MLDSVRYCVPLASHTHPDKGANVRVGHCLQFLVVSCYEFCGFTSDCLTALVAIDFLVANDFLVTPMINQNNKPMIGACNQCTRIP